MLTRPPVRHLRVALLYGAALLKEGGMAPPSIRMLLADVDGTLVTEDKVLTAQAIDAVDQLRQAGILFAITSGRPPRGMGMLIAPLDLQTPIAAFNGGLIVDREMTVLEQRVLPEDLVVPSMTK